MQKSKTSPTTSQMLPLCSAYAKEKLAWWKATSQPWELSDNAAFVSVVVERGETEEKVPMEASIRSLLKMC